MAFLSRETILWLGGFSLLCLLSLVLTALLLTHPHLTLNQYMLWLFRVELFTLLSTMGATGVLCWYAHR